MKKFITTIPPMQKPEHLTDNVYIAANNELLENDMKTCFPVIPLIKAYCDEGEKIEIIAVYTDDDICPYCKEHYERFKKQAETFLSGINYEIKLITIKYDESVAAHLDTFFNIVSYINEGDTLFADITYGTKPLPIIQIMALNYALRAKSNTQVECLVYGSKDFATNETKIYDVTSLLYVDEIINNMANMNIEDIPDILKTLL